MKQLIVIACRRRANLPKCAVPGCFNQATHACDQPVGKDRERTCDADLCAQHAIPIGEDKHLCPPHHRKLQRQP